MARQNTRSELLDSALRLFVAFGYDGVGVQQIAESAGVTKPTLYHYFGSKLGVLEALFEERLGAMHQALQAVTEPREDLSRALTEMACATFAFALAHPQLYRLYLSLWFAASESDAYKVSLRFHERHYAIVEGAFNGAVGERGLMKAHRRAHAAAFLGLLNSCISLGLNGRVVLNDRLARRSVQRFLFGIFA